MADLCIIDADPSEPPSHDAVITLANHLLSEFNIPTKILKLEDISAALFVVLYESLFSDKLPGIIRQPLSREDEIHNCQIVIDVLSTDVVRDSLSHIRAVDIVAGDITAISNLLDIFSYLLEYVINRIESDGPTDNDETRSLVLSESDLGDFKVKSPLGDIGKQMKKKEATKSEKPKVGSALSNKTNNNGGRTLSQRQPSKTVPSGKKTTASLNTNENKKVIRHEDLYAMTYGSGTRSFSQRAPSPIKPDDSQSLLGQRTIDSDFDIDNWDKKQQPESLRVPSPKMAWEEKEKSDQESKVKQSEREERAGAAASAAAATLTTAASVAEQKATNVESSKPDRAGGDIYSTAVKETLQNVSSFSSSLPAPRKEPQYEKSDPLRSTVGPISYHSRLTPEKPMSERKELSAKGFSSSLDDLRHLVEKTAALTRVALETSPVRVRTERDLDVTDPYLDRPRPTIPNEGVRLAKELNALGLGSAHTGGQSPKRGGKKVAFAASNVGSEYDSRFDEDPLRRPLTALPGNRYGSELRSAYRRDFDYDSDRDSDFLYDESDFRRRINNKDVAYGDIPADALKPERKLKSGPSRCDKTPSLVTHLARNRQPELGAAHMTLKTEDRAMQRKQDILRKMYDEDLDEFSEEVKYMLDKETKKSRETEEQFKKKCAPGHPKKKAPKKAKGTLVPPSCKKPRISRGVVSSKVKKRSYDQHPVPASAPLKLESEEDLLPVLLEEFPHLHLSEHTWHELWRHGLHRIEALTRAYNASQRKKSQAQNQLEDAAQRHELLGNIMKKQLDHTKRLREIKEQKQLQVQLRNKSHEKRMQSARARKYYNEYQVRARGKQLKRRTKEEMVFRELFKEALDIQKERIKDIRQYASDQRKRQESRRQNEIDSMENFYRDQFEMLTERLTQECRDTEVRETAQQKVLERMKRELRQKMEAEIKQYQDQLFHDEDDAHWRQVDADRIKQQLHMARYSAKI
ncbi:centrosomal protein of 95 kDa [Aplysia californica]|uniref:Centrosomal protein of 95 kDa n=1 Tax=Aplysia californica TaxID=6500 RepID=A0ABM0K0V7_APLCA|nr:centrosomal protein of 95 kDa [Aplysia californica]